MRTFVLRARAAPTDSQALLAFVGTLDASAIDCCFNPARKPG